MTTTTPTPTRPLVLITGASSGLGQAMALVFYRAGYGLALLSRRTEPMAQWVEQHQIPADRVLVIAADVSNPSDVRQAGLQCIQMMGVPDVVIANAGISMGMDTAEPDDLAVMNRVFATNVTGMAATFSPFINAMRERGSGTLVGIASVAGIRGMPGHGAYCSSKAAAISYCESLRGELRTTGIKVVTLCPGYVATPLTSKNPFPMPFLMQADAFAEQAFKTIERQTSYRVIPWQMAIVAKGLRLIPNAWFDRIFSAQPRKPRQSHR